MKIILDIKNFGKVKSAEIIMGGLSVFIGNNNSGKTYIMQLIYGIRKNLAKYLSDADLCCRYLQRLEQQADTGRVQIDAGTIGEVETFINAVLQKYKENIVLDTFHEVIEIGGIYVRLLMEEEERFEWMIYRQDDSEVQLGEILSQMDEKIKILMEDLKAKDLLQQVSCVLYKFHMNANEEVIANRIYVRDVSICSEIVCMTIDSFIDEFDDTLFLPASRTGLFMLYKEFFANKADEAVKALRIEDFERDRSGSQKLGITKPVYDFLRFLQTYRPQKDAGENGELMRFIEEHLIEGRILIDQAGQPVYQAQRGERKIPLYLSSSMVNELTPVLFVLQNDFKYLIWDEIETSLHPQKQMELARLLSRMSNAGYSMIVSTHSDTMAAKINNLCLLSFSPLLRGKKRADILKKADLEEADLFKDRIHVYQFENKDMGYSSVRELVYDEVTGYEFSLFNDSVEKLLEETRLILE